MAHPRGEPRVHREALGGARTLVLAAAVIVYFTAFVAVRPLSAPDESRYAGVAREMLVTGDFVTPRLNGVPFLDKPPLLYWAEAAALAAFGVTPGAARLVPALFGALGVLAAFAAARALFGARAALLGALVLATSPLYYAGSQYVNADLAVAVLIAASILAFLVGLERDRGRWFLAAYACAALATLTKGLIGAVLPALVLGATLALAGRLRDLARCRLPLGITLYAAIVVPCFALVQHANPDFFDYFVIGQHFGRYTGSGLNNPQRWWFYLAAIAVGLLPWTLVVLEALARRTYAAWRGARARPAELALIVWAVVVTVFFSLPESKIVGYILPALPPLALLAGLRLQRALDEAGGTSAAPIALSAGAALSVGVAAAAALVLLPRPAHAAAGFASTAGVFAALVIIAALVALALLVRRRRGAAVASVVVCAAAMCAGSALLARHFIDGNAAALAARLRPELVPDDVIAHFRGYFYAVPFVLDRRGPDLVADPWDPHEALAHDNWRRELYLGLQRRPAAAAWLVPLDELDRVMRGPARAFVFVDEKDLAELLQRAPGTVVARSGHLAVVENRPAAARERP